jgi:hypothetical protein
MNENQAGRDAKTGRFLEGNQWAAKHGGYKFLATGKLPRIKGTRRLKNELTRIKKQLESDVNNLDVKKSLLINQIVKSVGFCSLFELYCRKMGLLDPAMGKKGKLDFQPGFRVYLSLLNAQKNAIMALGMDEKQVEETLTPFELIQKEEREGKRPEN